MSSLKEELLEALESKLGVKAVPSPVAGGTALVFKGVEFAHFHHDHELDLKLTKKVIKQEQLEHPSGSTVHPKRSPNSHWLEVRYKNSADVARVVELVKLAIDRL